MNEQEARAGEFLRRKLGYTQVIHGEENIKALLDIKTIVSRENTNCADIIGFRPSMAYAQGAVVCESKGTAVKPFAPSARKRSRCDVGEIQCRVAADRAAVAPLPLSSRMVEAGESVGPDYLVGEHDRRGLHSLVYAGTDDHKPAPASPQIDMKRLDAKLQFWGEQVSKLPVYVCIERRASVKRS